MDISFLQGVLWGLTYFHQVIKASRNKFKNPITPSQVISEGHTHLAYLR